MKKTIEDNIKDAFENWDKTDLAFNEERVWGAIAARQHQRKKLRFYPIAAAIFLLLSGGIIYQYLVNQALERQYQSSLLEISQLKKESEVALKSQQPVVYQTQVKEVLKESPELQLALSSAKAELGKLKQRQKALKMKLSNRIAQVELLRDSVSILKNTASQSLLAEEKSAVHTKETGSQIKIKIDEEFLAKLPLKKRKGKANKLQIKIIDRNEGIPQTSAPLFSSIALN